MTEKNEALRLADRLESRWALHPDMQEAAAELRRLHASCEDYAHHKQRQDQRILKLYAQRDALLEALKLSRAQWIHSVNSDHCLAAIAKAEENT